MSNIRWFDRSETDRLIAYVEREFNNRRPRGKISRIILPDDCFLEQWVRYKKVWQRVRHLDPNDVIHVEPVKGKVVSIPMPHDFVWQEVYDSISQS